MPVGDARPCSLSVRAKLTSVYAPAIEAEIHLPPGPEPAAFHLDGSLGPTPLVIAQLVGATPLGATGFVPHARGGRIRALFVPASDKRQAPRAGSRILRRLGGPYPFVAQEIRLRFTRTDGAPLRTLIDIALPRNAICYSDVTEGLSNTFAEGDHGEYGSASMPRSVLGRLRVDTPRFSGIAETDRSFKFTLRYRPFAALRIAAAPVLLLLTAFLLDIAAIQASGPGWQSDARVLLAILLSHTAAATAIAAVPGGEKTVSLIGVVKAASWGGLLALTIVLRAGVPVATLWLLDFALATLAIYLTWATIVSTTIYARIHTSARRERYLDASMAAALALAVLAFLGLATADAHLPLTETTLAALSQGGG